MLNRVILIGRMANDPEPKTTQVEFLFAVSESPLTDPQTHRASVKPISSMSSLGARLRISPQITWERTTDRN